MNVLEALEHKGKSLGPPVENVRNILTLLLCTVQCCSSFTWGGSNLLPLLINLALVCLFYSLNTQETNHGPSQWS